MCGSRCTSDKTHALCSAETSTLFVSALAYPVLNNAATIVPNCVINDYVLKPGDAVSLQLVEKMPRGSCVMLIARTSKT